MPSRRARVALGQRRRHAPRVCAALVGELHAVCIRGTPTLPALGLLPSEKGHLTDDEKQPGAKKETATWASAPSPGAVIYAPWKRRFPSKLQEQFTITENESDRVKRGPDKNRSASVFTGPSKTALENWVLKKGCINNQRVKRIPSELQQIVIEL